MNDLTKTNLRVFDKLTYGVIDGLINRFDEARYPEEPYREFIEVFSTRGKQNNQIEAALKWKWGHWSKKNYPPKHKSLVKLVAKLWPEYIDEDCNEPLFTFRFWSSKLGVKNRFVTATYISHLLHETDIPIVDQHNYRAVIKILILMGRQAPSKKKPSNWDDITLIQSLIKSLSEHTGKSSRDLDKFLWMYGKYCASR